MDADRKDKATDPGGLDEIARMIRQIQYGEVIITIHDSRVVQIEKREKKRLTPSG